VAVLIKIVAEFRHSIANAIPEIVELVKNQRWKVYRGAAEALFTLSEHSKRVNIFVFALLMNIIAEFRPFIGTAIPDIAKLLGDFSWSSGPLGGAETLSRLSERGNNIAKSLGLLFS
jgi:hypothetical protein